MHLYFGKDYRLVVGLVLLSGLILSGCASDKDIAYLNDRIAAVDNRVTTLQKQVDTEQSNDIVSIRGVQTDMMSDLSRVKAELQELRGTTEENSYMLKHGSLKGGSGQELITTGIEDLSKRVLALETGLEQVQTYLNLQEVSSGETAGAAQPVVSPPVSTSGAVGGGGQPPAGPAKPIEPDKALYDQVMAEYRAGHYDKALDGFNAFLSEYPKSSLADNAQFWLGESYMALKQYEQAILAYQKVIKNYPNGNKVPSAMLRQALAFYEIKDKTSCNLLLGQIIKKYPNSPEAKIAKSKLETLK